MRKLYFTYLICAVCIAFVITFSLGFSNGFASYLPVAALFGAIFLFTVATPVLVYNARMGLFLGFIGCISILPYNFFMVKEILTDGVYNWVALFAISLLLLIIWAFYFTVKLILTNTSHLPEFSNKYVRLICSFTPIILFGLYLFLYGRYWGLAMFII